MSFQCKVAGIQEGHFRFRQILLECFCFCSWWQEKRIVLAPYRQQRRLVFTEVFMQLRIHRDVVAVVVEQVQLDVFLLFTHRSDNLNMSSTWLCSRNDLIANVGVLLAVGGSYLLESRWPDIVAGLIIAGLFLVSAIDVLKQSITALRVLDPVDPIVKPSVIQLEQLRRISSKSESGMK